ncbi:uncharacterized protein LOC108714581 isoform X2 [Xenopus laevis]|uniref:Uncharacterized protein LOC108714581 isoform X2 n=1 Tax=Xenopus laevis TaxID=8355 RepID=A0A8J0V3M9_XENLA|nr:uncharacterized protein LOC108714581 isoform X2 [Xenopus laevis]
MSNLDLSTGGYKWHRHMLHGADIFRSDEFKDRLTKESTEDFLNKRSASIQLHNAGLTDTGLYFCEVEFSGPMQITGHGNGTFLNVTVTGNIASSNKCTAYIVVGALALISTILLGACLGYLLVTKHGSSTRDMSPVVCTDLTTQALRSGGEPSHSLQQGSQNAGDTLYNMNNDQYIYAVPKGQKKSQFPKECLEVSLYSEIP